MHIRHSKQGELSKIFLVKLKIVTFCDAHKLQYFVCSGTFQVNLCHLRINLWPPRLGFKSIKSDVINIIVIGEKLCNWKSAVRTVALHLGRSTRNYMKITIMKERKTKM